jgi:hypothetical protein
MKKKQQYPPGWDKARVQRVLDHYDNLSEEEWIAEDEAAAMAEKNHLPVPLMHTTNGTQCRPKRKGAKTTPRIKRKLKRAKQSSKR